AESTGQSCIETRRSGSPAPPRRRLASALLCLQEQACVSSWPSSIPRIEQCISFKEYHLLHSLPRARRPRPLHDLGKLVAVHPKLPRRIQDASRSSYDSRRTGKREPHAVPATSCSVVVSANPGGFDRGRPSNNIQKYTICSQSVKRSLPRRRAKEATHVLPPKNRGRPFASP